MIRPQLILDINEELIVNLFAGGGGSCIAIEMATGRHVDIAANHDRAAVAMHRMNHPQTQHFTADVWEIDPVEVTRGRPVGLLHFSPDCTDHSQAAAGQPRDVAIRSLAWVGLRWAGTVRPRVITLENVKQMRNWGNLIAKRCPETGRVVKRDKTVAAPGERVPVQEQHLVVDPKRKGRIWRKFKRAFEELGYVWNDQDIVAADYGAPTSRARLFAIARRDGGRVDFPPATHFKPAKRGQKRQREAWECIDFALPCYSVLMTQSEAKRLKLRIRRPLKRKSNVRFALGCERFVMKAAEPFLVCITHGGGGRRVYPVTGPHPTITGANRGEYALGFPFLARYTTGSIGSDVRDSAPTMTANGFKKRPGGAIPIAVSAAFLARPAHGAESLGKKRGLGIHGVSDPMGTLPCSNEFAVAAVSLARYFNTEQAPEIEGAMPAETSGGNHTAVVAHYLAQNNEGEVGHDMERAMSTIAGRGGNQSLAACALAKYYGTQQAPDLSDAMDAATTKDRFAMEMAYLEVPPLTPEKAENARKLAVWLREHGVTVEGEFAMCGPFVIWDLGMRMLEPREQYLAQGFPVYYEIDKGVDEFGNEVVFTKEQKTRMCGNSVSPPPYMALVKHWVPELCVLSNRERRAA